jgi:hypothetical protein
VLLTVDFASVSTELSQQSTYSCVARPAVLLTVDLSSTRCLDEVSMTLIPVVEEVDTSHSTVIRQIDICII